MGDLCAPCHRMLSGGAIGPSDAWFAQELAQTKRQRDALLEAAKVAEEYIVMALGHHDDTYQRHPSSEAEREVIVRDLSCLREAANKTEGTK